MYIRLLQTSFFINRLCRRKEKDDSMLEMRFFEQKKKKVLKLMSIFAKGKKKGYMSKCLPIFTGCAMAANNKAKGEAYKQKP